MFSEDFSAYFAGQKVDTATIVAPAFGTGIMGIPQDVAVSGWTLILLLSLVGVGSFLLVSLTLYWVRWKMTRRGHQSNARGLQKEKEAEKWFIRQGYAILKSQPVREGQMLLDRQKESFEVQPDFILEKKGQKWVVDVKSGRHGSVTLAATRRQLREYAAMFPECKCGLLDARSWNFHEIEFLEGTKLDPTSLEQTELSTEDSEHQKFENSATQKFSWKNWWALLMIYAVLVLILGTVYWMFAI